MSFKYCIWETLPYYVKHRRKFKISFSKELNFVNKGFKNNFYSKVIFFSLDFFARLTSIILFVFDFNPYISSKYIKGSNK